jgi:hypothetical protein
MPVNFDWASTKITLKLLAGVWARIYLGRSNFRIISNGIQSGRIIPELGDYTRDQQQSFGFWLTVVFG